MFPQILKNFEVRVKFIENHKENVKIIQIGKYIHIKIKISLFAHVGNVFRPGDCFLKSKS